MYLDLYIPCMYMFLCRSSRTSRREKVSVAPIYLIYQFFRHRTDSRHSEIQEVLRRNVANSLINTVYLLNERIYSDDDLGVPSGKVQQRNIGHRLLLSDIFNFVEKEGLEGYIITCNADIFFDQTLKNLYRSGLDREKAVYCQLRFEYTDKKLNRCKLFGPRADSQDAWIFHSTYNPRPRERRGFRFKYGMPGCDNKAAYMYSLVGFELRNDPFFIKIFHYHTTEIRDYTPKMHLPRPSMMVAPYINRAPLEDNIWGAPLRYCAHFKVSLGSYVGSQEGFIHNMGNNIFRKFLEARLETDTPFIVARTGTGLALNLSYVAQGLYSSESVKNQEELLGAVKKMLPLLKRNCGVRIGNDDSLARYSGMYLSAFPKADLTLGWAPWDESYQAAHSPHTYIYEILGKAGRPYISAGVLDLFNFIHNDPWSTALSGKRLLIVSNLAENIKDKIDIREKIYGVDLFPDCKFSFIKSPEIPAHGDTEEFSQKFTDFCMQIDSLEGHFDVALLSCGGYGAPLLHHFHQIGKSAIDVGAVLQTYFGIYNRQWMSTNREALCIYLNEYWSMFQKTGKSIT